MAKVTRFNVAPVKSTRLHHPNEIRLESYGAVGNRLFFCVDDEGRRFSGNAKAPLMQVWADHDREREHLTLRMPNGETADGSAVATAEGIAVDLWGREVRAHVLEGDFEEALTRFAGRPVRMARVDREGDANDERPVTLVSIGSVEELSRQGGREDVVDPGRFRMTIEIDGCAPHEEDGWQGRRIGVGEAVIEVGEQVPRCVVTTLNPETGAPDFPTLKVIKAYRGLTADGELPFGVYADVVEPGAVRVGDPLRFLG